jgi:signal transduction histidine kinase
MIYRYLAMASAFLLIATMGLIAWFYHKESTRDLVDMTARHNVAIDRILSNTIWAQYDDYLLAAGDIDAETLRSRPEIKDIHDAIAVATEGVKILKVKIYNGDGVILFSSEPEDIGGDYSESPAFRASVDEGRISSALSFEDRVSAFSGELFDRDVVETYLPRFDANGEVIGVFELYADVTENKDRIDATTVRLTLGLAVIFAVVYAILVIGIIGRAIEPIRLASRRAAEIGPKSSGARLPTKGMPREILPLITAINGALTRLDGALDAQRRFTSDAAHELLTPLAVLRAQLGSLNDRSIIEPAHREIDAMTEMVHQFLQLAELESLASASPDGDVADAHGVALDVISMLAPLAVRDGKEIELTGAQEPVPVRGSTEMLKHVLRNIIENAVRHTPPETTIEVYVEKDGLVRVSDMGPGVPENMRERVFERFWRGDKNREIGAGLGLSIVKRVVEMIDGRIWIEDAPGGGTCFAIQFVRATREGDPTRSS